MFNKPNFSEVVLYMRKDFSDFISNGKMEPEEAFSRLLEEYESTNKFGLEYEKIITITAISLAIENGFNYSNLEKHYVLLTTK